MSHHHQIELIRTALSRHIQQGVSGQYASILASEDLTHGIAMGILRDNQLWDQFLEEIEGFGHELADLASSLEGKERENVLLISQSFLGQAREMKGTPPPYSN